MLEDRKTLVIEEEEQKPKWKKSFKATRTTTTTTTTSFSTTCIITSSLVRNPEKVTDAHLCYTLAQQRYHKNSRKTKPKTQKKQRAMRAENDGGRAQPSAHSVVDCRRALRLWFPYTLSSSPKGSVTSTPPSSWMNEIFLIQVPSLLFHPTA
jgi:hypothetical protein